MSLNLFSIILVVFCLDYLLQMDQVRVRLLIDRSRDPSQIFGSIPSSGSILMRTKQCPEWEALQCQDSKMAA